MVYLAHQFGNTFFTLKKIEGYQPSTILGTKITEEEFKKLFYSNPQGRDVVSSAKGPRGSIQHYRIYGNASTILGREVFTTDVSESKEKQRFSFSSLFTR